MPKIAAATAADVNPESLRHLLESVAPDARQQAWDVFVTEHSRLMVHVARSVMPSGDGAMDAYAHLLERLQRDQYRVLAGYMPDGRSRFTTWLVVVARRTCVDFYRQRYGRPRGRPDGNGADAERDARQRLVDFTMSSRELAELSDENGSPDAVVRSEQLHAALSAAIARLRPDDQLLLRLRFDDDLPAQRIAIVLGLPTPFHVYRRLKTVCATLHAFLLARGFEDSEP